LQAKALRSGVLGAPHNNAVIYLRPILFTRYVISTGGISIGDVGGARIHAAGRIAVRTRPKLVAAQLCSGHSGRMKVLVLGSAAGGGFPQWNCNCRNCRGVREGTIKAHARTQSSIAITADSLNWVIVNASPDILAQLKSNTQLQPARKIRDTGIRAIILVDSQIDHTSGLAMLREGEPLNIYCTANVHQDLTTAYPILRLLDEYCGVNWHPIAGSAPFSVPGIAELTFTTMAVQSKAPPYSPHRHSPCDGDNIALIVTNNANGKRLFYAPGIGCVDAAVLESMSSADCIMIDGTFWTDDEMIRTCAGKKRASEMGHLALAGKHGLLSFLHRRPAARTVLIHINNTNPILDEDSDERRELERYGIEVGYDGMEILL
jgi:pyrroloquinoline quinone biosynthesis protein B